MAARIKSVTKENASDQVRPLYDQLTKEIGGLPNIFLLMGNSPNTLSAFMQLNSLVSKCLLPADLKGKIALIVSETNKCNYCLSAHSQISKAQGLSDQDILNARKAESSDRKQDAILKFAKKVVDSRGMVSDQDIASLKEEKVSDSEICEIILVITLSMFTNYFNNVVKTELDFPLAPKL